MPETQQFIGMEGDGRNDTSLKANVVLKERYKVLGVIGGGGMGTVYQARDLNFTEAKRLVAIKEMQSLAIESAQRATMLRNFQREANILAAMSHPAIPKIFDFWDVQDRTQDRAYLVMEYINGRDLEAILAQTRELPIEKIVEWSIELCDVLDYLHNQTPNPIIFRDMKPSNIMIDALGRVRLIDFGIAKAFVPDATGKGTMIGTEGYSAPEQYKGEATPASDLYGLGATLHHLLTRKDPRLEIPFSFHERPIPNYNDKVPPKFVAIIEKSLAKDIPDRFQSAAEMRAALEDLRARPASAPVTVSSPNAAPSDNSTSFFDDITENSGSVQPKWVFKTEDEIRSAPTLYRDVALVGSYDTNIWALRLENGEQVWKYATKGGIASSPTVDETNKNVVFGSEDFSIYALDVRSGRISWTFQTKDRIRSAPRVAHDHVFIGSDDGKVYALNALNGRKLWEYDAGAPIRSRPYVTNDVVIITCASGELYGLSLSGQRKWAYRTRGAVYSSPYVEPNEGVMFVGSSDGYMYAFDAQSGVSSWRFRTGGPVISSPTENKGLLYFGSTDGYLYAVNAQTSREKWKFNAEKPIVGSPAVHKGSVYFGGTDDYFYCLDAENGKERWRFKMGGAITAAPTIAADLILVGSLDHKLYAFPLIT
jgi:outer membrane protein assembly factor BamB/predicted Ser/Thr protein kinase